MAFVGEAVVSALIETLFDKLASSDLLRFVHEEEVVADIKKWKKTLRKLRAVLVDAEEKQLTSELVRMWLEDLTDLAYDVEDILDEFATEALRRKYLMAETTTQPIAKVRSLLMPSSCATSAITTFSPSSIKFNAGMRSRMDDITSRFKHISAEKNDLHLADNVVTSTRPAIPGETTSHVDESLIPHRGEEEATILNLLLDRDVADRVIAIIGMGALGKTTLAQVTYSHVEVQTHFDLKVWVRVSDDFDVTRLTKTILESVDPKAAAAKNLNQLQTELKNRLSGKKFLLVLDDVWNENYQKWEDFYLPIRKSGAQVIRVIVTTRNQGVVKAVGGTTSTIYPLEGLSDAECLSLLAKRAFSAESFDKYPNLRDIAKQIAEKCRGLPVVAQTLGGMLRGKQNPDAWEEILKSNIWNLPDQQNNDIFPALKLSYHHLPSHLKRCFAYCSIFPKDYKFEENELVLLWMAEGFLDNVNGRKQMEEIGTEYLRELLARSFFQQPNPKSSHFVMHDIVHDLARFVAGDTCFNQENKLGNNEQHAIPERARHSSFIRQSYEVVGKFKAFIGEVKTHIRTLASLPSTIQDSGETIQDSGDRGHISQKVLHDLLTGMRCLRVLSLTDYSIKEVPDVIGNLKHLRYLNFSNCSSIERLPDSVCDLYNLQTLILRDCKGLAALPKGIGKLINLRHLNIIGTSELLEIPSQVANLTNLRSLSRFVVSKSGGLEIGGLRNLSDLQGELAISNLHEIVNVEDANDAKLRNKRKLEELVMKWSDKNWASRKSADHELKVLESLRPHETLKRLEVAFYGGSKFPGWIGDSSFSEMVSLTLRGCKKCMSLPALGALSSLEVLNIEGMGKVKRIGDEFYGGEYYCKGPFASLKELRFEDMKEWVSWWYSSSAFMKENNDERGAMILFPKLERLEIIKCPKLKGGLPKCLRRRLASPDREFSNLEEQDEGVLQQQDEGLLMFSNLKFLSIEKCDNLKELLLPNGRLHGVEELKVKDCPHLESFLETGLPPMLRRLKVEDCQRLKRLPDLRNSSCSSSCALESLKIEKCPSLRCFHPPPTSSTSSSGGGCGLPSTLKELIIRDCENLESPPPMMRIEGKYNSSTPSLECLDILNCKSIKLFPRELPPSILKRLVIWICSNLETMSLKVFGNNRSSLEYVELRGCPNLRRLTLHPECIKKLNIFDCKGLEYCCFPERGLLSPPCILTELLIKGCPQLKSLPHQMKDLSSLTCLIISDCPALESFPQGGLAPTNLKELQVLACQNLRTPISAWGLQSLCSLSTLIIEDMFPNMVSFPMDECMFPSSLTLLRVCKMSSLISFSLPTLHSLTSLEMSYMPSLTSLFLPPLPSLTSLAIRDMKSLTSLSLPSSLTSLKIWEMPSLTSLPLPILHSLTTLVIAEIKSLTSLSLPKLDSLTSLKITKMKSLTSLSLPKLDSLTSLEIKEMESLDSLPLQNFTSLRTLYISDWPKLRSLGSLLPATLGRLTICNCPIITKRCLKGKGEFFPNIAYIPCIEIDGELIHIPLKYTEQKWKWM